MPYAILWIKVEVKLPEVSAWKVIMVSTIESDLDLMAADPDIQREIGMINAEFAVAEADGLAADR